MTPNGVRLLLGATAVLGAALLALGRGSAAHSQPAACAYEPERVLRARAQLVFDAVALRGPSMGRMLLSPARFRVSHYLKGRGPRTVLVQTATWKSGRGTYRMVSEHVNPRAGERWRIYGRLRGGIVRTSLCAGSRRR